MRSYEEAAKACKAKVDAIVRECKRLNVKYCDRLFQLPSYDSLASLISTEYADDVGAVKRVGVSDQLAPPSAERVLIASAGHLQRPKVLHRRCQRQRREPGLLGRLLVHRGHHGTQRQAGAPGADLCRQGRGSRRLRVCLLQRFEFAPSRRPDVGSLAHFAQTASGSRRPSTTFSASNAEMTITSTPRST